MNPFDIDVVSVHGELPTGGVIPGQRLDEYLGATAVLQRHRSRAAAILLAARRVRASAREQARHILQQAWCEAQRRADDAARAAHDATCAEVVGWLVQERELEARVAAQLEARCRNWVADAVMQFTGEMDRTALLIGRIERQLAPLARHGALRLHVCPEEMEAISRRLVARDGIELQADPGMQPGQARIDSPFVQLRIDLARHLAMLLERIRDRGLDEGEACGTTDGAAADAVMPDAEGWDGPRPFDEAGEAPGGDDDANTGSDDWGDGCDPERPDCEETA
ncbi:hypothetical protein [Cupriavidus sp. AU9028]|uniref:hypothetical protein n=1 Tax=Cupriavidus sp. AU9028 TaxID=2871157 RepID=UPI001C98E01B|nr:hypothetical protein [Cupriavidus sp. AU9028]MBY4897873.1 hypothetical protein [Cupriavidus sp. AU9028]